jgi:hypothetical protein
LFALIFMRLDLWKYLQLRKHQLILSMLLPSCPTELIASGTLS